MTNPPVSPSKRFIRFSCRSQFGRKRHYAGWRSVGILARRTVGYDFHLGEDGFSPVWRAVVTSVKLLFHTGEATVYIGSLHTDILLSWTKVQHIPVRFNLISTLLLQITGECSTPSLTYRFGGITDFFTRQVVGNEWNEVAEEFYILRKTKLSFYRFDHEGWTGARFWNLVMLLLKI